ncbi:uncharacterized protein LOC112344877 [Selaginella moellendorffii]|uniref:uncharacterized protein LOC112344877 n=1 Tax=Selaginella moellendorffii TaxID=88036 RepID=UPI000D1C8BDE|nr:uncharacterized protein LOC112344877 [Selaginella moellendorffii]|eukprot:XP_024526184.1 uncharacterized protein LOC112344877 [Selaginella moellendorffii]
MAAAAAGAAAAAAPASSSATLMDQHASSSGCSCSFCRHSCCCAGGLSEDKARLAAALIAARSGNHTSAIASLVLFAASVGVILAKLGSSSSKAPLDRRARGQMHFFHRRRHYHLGQVVKRKSRWEWRPVTRRSTGSQTVQFDLAAISSSLSQSPAKFSPSPMVVEASSQIPEEPCIASLVDFPGLSRELMVVEDARPPAPPRSSEDVKDLVAVGLKLAPLPMVELLRTDSGNDASTSNVTHGDQEQEEQQQTMNRKQRKHLKKKQKKLVAASRTFQISSLPVLKSWKSSSSPPPPPSRKLVAATTPCKIYDCANKNFGPLGSSSSKAIAWTYSLSKPSARVSSSASSAPPLQPQPTFQAAAVETKVVHEISEISESPKSYLGDWTDSESSKRSNSDPEEIELPSLDFEFEEDSEDYTFQPSVPSH